MITLFDKIIEEKYSESTVHVKWHTKDKKKRNNEKFVLNRVLVKCLHRHITQSKDHISKVIGYTRAIITNPVTVERNIFYCHPSYQGGEWYDWAMVQFVEINENDSCVERMDPSKILAFIF